MALVFMGDSNRSLDMEKLSGLFAADDSISALAGADRSAVSKNFSVDVGDAEGYIYLRAEDVMDVSELLVVKTSDTAMQEALDKAAEERLDTLESAWENYGTNQYDLIQDAVILNLPAVFLLTLAAPSTSLKTWCFWAPASSFVPGVSRPTWCS